MQPNNDNSNQDSRKYRKIFRIIFAAVIILIFGSILALVIRKYAGQPLPFLNIPGQSEKGTFEENFQENKIIEETGKMASSSSSDWWVNSGAWMEIFGGTGKTIMGDIPTDSAWYKKYRDSNPRDTDDGLHPQNIFRLVMRRGQWQNFTQEAYFRINKINFSASENRNESNGILLFDRYEDGDNLYYTGLRVDGTSVIKKKYAGKYYTLKEPQFFPGAKYDRDANPNLLPLGVWIGLRSEFRNTSDGNVDIKLFVKVARDGEWKLAASAIDDGRKSFGTHIIDGAGQAGIRTDFMDVEFDDYKITEL